MTSEPVSHLSMHVCAAAEELTVKTGTIILFAVAKRNYDFPHAMSLTVTEIFQLLSLVL